MLESLKQASWLRIALILVPIAVLAIIYLVLPVYREVLAAQIEKMLRGSREKDEKLSQDIDKAKREADEHQAKADIAKLRREDLEKDDDANWNKKK